MKQYLLFLVPVGLSECETNPCRNGGTCYSVDDIETYKCHCAAGFKGIHCEGKRYIAVRVRVLLYGEKVVLVQDTAHQLNVHEN